MGVIGDVLAALKATSEWKELAEAARKIPALEKRIGELEIKLSGGGSACPSCGKAFFRLHESKPDSIFGRLGGNRRTYRCSACGFNEEKIET